MGTDRFAVQSFCYRAFEDNKVVARMVRETGVAAIELCGIHVDFQRPESWDEVLADYKGAGVEVVSMGVVTFRASGGAERNYFEFARKAGFTTISANFPAAPTLEVMHGAARLADEYDMRLAIHNHGGYHWLGSREILDMVFANTSPRIGLMLDTAWALDAKMDPVEAARRFGERLYGVHIKDFVFDRARNQEDVVVGTGNLDLPGLKAALDDVGFSGWNILEYEGDTSNPVPSLARCIDQMNQVWSPD